MGLCWSYQSSSPASKTETKNNKNAREISSSTVTTTTATTSRNIGGQSQSSEAVSKSSIGNMSEPNLKVYSFLEIKNVTKNFKPESILSQGGFGKVYKGWVSEKTLAPSKPGSGMIVAVKRLASQSVQGFAEWRSEGNLLGKLSHPNLVKLLGYCHEDNELLLVYEFMSKGSLESHLFRRSDPFPWDLRLKIVIGAARGLAFLHSSQREIIYRDLKASNILLDPNYEAKISDFGLAKLGSSREKSHITTQIVGTHGYAAPEYMTTGHLYVKSDVYAFGVVLLEIMTGLRAHDRRRPSGQENLVDWLRPKLESKHGVKQIMDDGIKGQYSSKAAIEMGRIALACTKPDPKSRPHMKEVLDVLKHIRWTNVALERSSTKPVVSSSYRSSSRRYQYSYRACAIGGCGADRMKHRQDDSW